MFETGKYEKIGYKLFLKYPNFRKKYLSQSGEYQIGFLLGLIKDFKFSNGSYVNNVLEIGIKAGVTSLYMLKQGCKRQDFNLMGIDISEEDFIGDAVFKETKKEEQAHYHLYKGHTSFDIEKIVQGRKLDMVFIDGAHYHPYPIIDLIHVIPFLHDESIVLLHDVVIYMKPNAWGESFIYEGWKDLKYRTVFLDSKLKPQKETSLGCIRIPSDKEKLYANILEIVSIPLRASPWGSGDYLGINEEHLNSLKMFMEKYYDGQFANMVFEKFYSNLKEYRANSLLYIHETRFYDFLLENSTRYNKLYTLKIIEKAEKVLKKILKPIVRRLQGKK